MRKSATCLGLLAVLLLSACAHDDAGKPATVEVKPAVVATEEMAETPTVIQESFNAGLESKPEVPTPIEAATKTDTKPVQLDWTKPSGGEYPEIKKEDDIWIEVEISEQNVYIKKADETIYTMTMSSGLDNGSEDETPRGTYYIEPERGDWFYAPRFEQGAQYWVSWKGHGKFLFHSVPMDKEQQVVTEEAKKLGQKASHGCIRLTIPDAKWIYEHIPTGTKIVIQD